MELLDIADNNDVVIGKASRSEIYRKLLCHRIVHVMVFNSAGEIFLQKRSSEVSFSPNHWSTSAGGHVQSDETYKEAALREYQEELETNSELEIIQK